MPSSPTTDEPPAPLGRASVATCEPEKVVFGAPDASALLDGRLAEVCDPGRHGWQRVKHNASRTVYRGRLGDQDVYVKHYHSRSLVRRLARRLGVSDAMWEMRHSRYLASCGVPTPPVLAAACANGLEWLATKAVWPAEPADVWHLRQLRAGRQGRRAVQQAIAALARMVGRMHAIGIIHRDLHCANILVRTDRSPRGRAHSRRPGLVVTDLHRVRRRRRLSRRAKAANLAQLLHDRYEVTTRTERLRFLKHYLRASGSGGTLRGWQLMVEEFAYRHRRRQYAQRDRRARGKNRYFSPIRLPGRWRGHVVLASKRRMAGSKAAEVELDIEQWRRALAHPEALFQAEDLRVVKSSRSGVVVSRRLTVGRHEFDVFIKRPRRKRPWKVLLDCFRPARALRAFRLGHALLTRRIATALPLAALERRVGPILLDNILITEAVKAPRLHEFLETWLAQPPRGDTPLSVAQQRLLAQEVLWQLGRLLQRLHDNNFLHRDLKATNTLVRWSAGSPPEVVLVDLHGLRRTRRLSMRGRFQGLMRLNVSLLQCPVVNHAGRLRMLLGYLRRPGSGRIHFKPYWRVLEEWSARKIRQQIRSRRKRQKAARRPTT